MNERETKSAVQAIKKLELNFQKKGIQDVILISPNNSLVSQQMTITFSPSSFNFPQNLKLSKRLIQNIEKASIPLRIVNTEKSGGDFSTPFHFSTNGDQKKSSILKIVHSKLGIESHFKLGQVIYQTIQEGPEKIAFIVSENFFYHSPFKTLDSQSSSKESLDQKIIHSIQKKDFSSFLKENQDSSKEKTGKEDRLSIIILLGFLQKWGKENWKPEVFSDKFQSKDSYAVINFVNS